VGKWGSQAVGWRTAILFSGAIFHLLRLILPARINSFRIFIGW
jgi:hypothetical protein